MKTLNEREKLIQPIYDSALKARHAGELNRAKALCLKALKMLDADDRRALTIVHGELGHIDDLQGNARGAELHFRCAVEASPRSELASLCLFHALADQGLWKSALTEALRFISLRDSAEYRQIFFSKGFREDLPPDELKLAEDARALLRKKRAK